MNMCDELCAFWHFKELGEDDLRCFPGFLIGLKHLQVQQFLINRNS